LAGLGPLHQASAAAGYAHRWVTDHARRKSNARAGQRA
jgi:hypothetical protein